MSSATLQEDPSVESFFNVAETETLALFEPFSFEFLVEFDVFAPAETGRTREHKPPGLMRGFFHCYYHDTFGIRPIERELQNTVVWLGCGFDQPPSRDAVDRFLIDLEHVVDELFDEEISTTVGESIEVEIDCSPAAIPHPSDSSGRVPVETVRSRDGNRSD